MLCQNAFAQLKDIYEQLPDASRSIAKIMSWLPAAALAIFGLTLVPLGIIGLGTLIMIGLGSTIAAGLMMAAVIPCGDETGLSGFVSWMQVLWSLRNQPAAEEAAEAEQAPVLRMAANDAGAVEEQAVKVAKEA